MTLSGESDSFDIYARGGQWWDCLRFFVLDGRAVIHLDGKPLELTRIQTEELGRWLVEREPRRPRGCGRCIYCLYGQRCPWPDGPPEVGSVATR